MPTKRVIERKSLPEVIADDIRERILSGELAEGETIRQETLAEEYDVSRMPIREALKRLGAEGLVQLTTNRGTTVTKHSLDEIKEIFHLRLLLELDMFRQSIPAMTEDHFRRCEEILAQMDASYDADDVAEWGRFNFEFHSALYACAGRLSNELLHRVSLQADRYVRIHLATSPERDVVKKEHRKLLDLARAGETDEACEVLETHINRAMTDLLKLMVENRSDEQKQPLN